MRFFVFDNIHPDIFVSLTDVTPKYLGKSAGFHPQQNNDNRVHNRCAVLWWQTALPLRLLLLTCFNFNASIDK